MRSSLITFSIFFTLINLSCEKNDNVNNSCRDDNFEVVSPDPTITILAPNAISPNNDNKNEQFVILALSKTSPYSSITFNSQTLTIFKFGTKDVVFKSLRYTNNFDGHNEMGNELAEGDYSYEATLDNIYVKGTLKIVRTTAACNCRAIEPNDDILDTSCP